MTQSASAKLASWESERAHYQGLGPLEVLLWRTDVTDIYVNGPDEVWVDGPRGLERTEIRFSSDDEVRELAVRILAGEGRRLDASQPCGGVHTTSGYRLHAVLPPIASGHTHLSIRIQPEDRPDLRDLGAAGMFGSAVESLLRKIVSAKKTFLISGSTGSGKTTLLNAMLGTCHPAERLLLIEDSSELAPRHPHAVSLRTRTSNAEGAGAVTLTDLIRESLRMGPDRIIVGECRGPEVTDLFLAMNTGHEGGGTTIHANSANAVPARLMALGALAAMSPEEVARQATTAIQVVIHLERGATGRRVEQVGMLEPTEAGMAVLPAVTVDASGDVTTTSRWPALRRLLDSDAGSPSRRGDIPPREADAGVFVGEGS